MSDEKCCFFMNLPACSRLNYWNSQTEISEIAYISQYFAHTCTDSDLWHASQIKVHLEREVFCNFVVIGCFSVLKFTNHYRTNVHVVILTIVFKQ